MITDNQFIYVLLISNSNSSTTHFNYYNKQGLTHKHYLFYNNFIMYVSKLPNMLDLNSFIREL
ncbi:hypothetical protein RchiOBHm_Chr6g0289291 [Rosa chinensis]|uniref:Uncharacterized protein n=1 Tax=Rosa chinensis TaxID=74649 RepID=A0A2P6PVJ4_ROSCH|nr:hypothetical protein RchiOBHm_Chr6g0289291 [Rosa chinensis]